MLWRWLEGLVFQEERGSVQSAKNNENVSVSHSFWFVLIDCYFKVILATLLSTVKIKPPKYLVLRPRQAASTWCIISSGLGLGPHLGFSYCFPSLNP